MSAARVANLLPGVLDKHLPPSMLTSVGGPVPNSSRVGRHQQRYGETGERLVAGCIPIRYPGSVPKPDTVEVLLITSRGGKGWVFPKGGWEDDETVEAAARRETVEEAGVRGSIEEPMLGTFCFQSAKQERIHNVHQGRCRAYMFVMRVAEELEIWPECPDRQRCWVLLSEASSKCRHQWMRDALNAWILRQGWQQLLPPMPDGLAPVNSDSGSLTSG
eukprot:GHRR01006054.1.p1 GENE.GHRR01006054.1~~GHRR01006054.1.p1  ORF type:complete len:218 (+),score=61.62 GHRR01006054.1:400-1053(+)